VACSPVAREFLHHCERHALRLVCDGFLLGPLGGRDAPAKIGELFFRNLDVEGADLGGARRLARRRNGHGGLPVAGDGPAKVLPCVSGVAAKSSRRARSAASWNVPVRCGYLTARRRRGRADGRSRSSSEATWMPPQLVREEFRYHGTGRVGGTSVTTGIKA